MNSSPGENPECAGKAGMEPRSAPLEEDALPLGPWGILFGGSGWEGGGGGEPFDSAINPDPKNIVRVLMNVTDRTYLGAVIVQFSPRLPPSGIQPLKGR